MNLDLQKDSELITKFIVIEAGLSDNTKIVKQADLVSEITNIGNSIVEDIKERFQKEGWAALATYAAYTKLGMLNPLYWILMAVDKFLGISPGTLINDAIKAAKNIFDKTGDFTPSDADAVANSVVGGLGISASLDHLYDLEKQGKIVSTLSDGLVKEAAIGKSFFRLISKLNPIGRKKLSGGLAKWFIKLLFTGIAAAWALTKGVAKAETPGAVVEEVTGPSKPESKVSLPSASSHNLKSSGKGVQFHTNQGNTIWIVPLVNNNIKETLIKWAVNVYPELKDKISELNQSSSINRMASLLGTNYNPQYPGYLQILPGLHTWKDIVDRSIGDVV